MRMIVGLVSSLGLAAACSDFDRGSEALVRVTDRPGNPVVGADVWSHDAAGARIGVASTGSDGVAIVPVVAGGAVTVHEEFFRFDTSGEWRTKLGIAPGDEVTFEIQGGNDVVPDPAFTTTTELTLPTLPPNTWRIRMRTPCGSANSFVAMQTLTLRTFCDGPTTVVAMATDSSYATIGYAVVRDIDLRTTASVVIPGAWEVPSATWTVDVRGMPAGITDVSATRALASPLATITAHADGFYRDDIVVSDTSIDGLRPDIADPAHYLVNVGVWNGGARFVVSTNEAAVDGITVDLRTIARPTLTFSPDGRQTSWTAVPDADLVTIEQVVTNTTGDVIGPYWTWHVTAPPATTSFDFFGDVGFPFVGTPASMNAHFDHIAVSTWDATWFPGYEELRALAVPPPPPADAPYTLRSGGDAFEDDRRAYPPF